MMIPVKKKPQRVLRLNQTFQQTQQAANDPRARHRTDSTNFAELSRWQMTQSFEGRDGSGVVKYDNKDLSKIVSERDENLLSHRLEQATLKSARPLTQVASTVILTGDYLNLTKKEETTAAHISTKSPLPARYSQPNSKERRPLQQQPQPEQLNWPQNPQLSKSGQRQPTQRQAQAGGLSLAATLNPSKSGNQILPLPVIKRRRYSIDKLQHSLAEVRQRKLDSLSQTQELGSPNSNTHH